MAKKKSLSPRSTGRQLIPIDWTIVDSYLEAECNGVEVASLLGVHPDTLYNRCLEEKGEIFTTYSAKKKAKGDSMIRKVQYDAALAGDKTMMVWLGKNRLKQSDKSEIKTGTFQPHVQKLLSHWESLGDKQQNSEKSE